MEEHCLDNKISKRTLKIVDIGIVSEINARRGSHRQVH